MELQEVIVRGTPVSLQAKKAASRTRWVERVKQAAYEAIRAEDQLDCFTHPGLRVWVLYFHFGDMEGDLDNIAKPILDAMNGPGRTDDRQLARLELCRIRLDPERPVRFDDPPLKVQHAIDLALREQQDFVYVRAQPDEPDARIP